MAELIRGYVEHIIYRNEDNGYTVLSLSADAEEITLVGNLPRIHEGEYLEAEGSYLFHPTYGEQFKADTAKVTIPVGGAALERYLASGAVKGVGEALASRIVRRFGEDTMRILEEEPERLAEIKGISMRKAREIGRQIEERSHMQNALLFLAQYGISLQLGIRIYEQYQERIYDVLRENPYELAETMHGVGFKIADEIASRVGIRADSEYRIRSGLLYALSQASAQGHVALPEEDLLQKAEELLGVAAELLQKYVTDLSLERKLVVRSSEAEDGTERILVYTPRSFFQELDTARMLRELDLVTTQDVHAIREKILQIEEEEARTPDAMQLEAVITAATHGLMILTGGPGTGKTTTINTMIRFFERERASIALAAPTGRAAKRMTEATGWEASTIHRLLEVSGDPASSGREGRFGRNEENPLDVDVVIIDEVSMVDLPLMHALLSAILPGTRLILVGDADQLPSVGPGSVLRDMIRSGAFPVIALTKIFRQAQESDIIVNAHKIRDGQEVVLDNQSKDFFFLKRDNVQVIQKILVTLVTDKLPRYVHAEPFDIQVLSPMRKGPLGVESLNTILQAYLNPPAENKEERILPQGILREGDKVMQIRNDYQLVWEIRGKYGIAAQRGEGVFNGDMGRIKKIDPALEILTVEFEEGREVDYPFRQLDELELAYAVTVHKAQGSEYPAVVIPLLGVPYLLQTRSLLYTAVTRAKECVVLLGEEQTFRAMASNRKEESRYTTLAERIQELA